MAYQEIKRTSYGKNLGNSFKGIIIGILLVVVGTVFIFRNENRAIKQYKAINRAQDACVEMPDISRINAEFDGKTVHCNGIAKTEETLNDENFGVSVNGLALHREVEYYQWVENKHTEKKDKIGGATEEITTYTYNKKWVSSPQDNDFKDPDFKGENFVFVEVPEMDWEASVVNLGAYTLPSFITKSIGDISLAPVNMDSTTISEWNKVIKKRLGLADTIQANYVYTEGNTVYLGASASNPEVGDVRVTLTYIPNNQEISLIAKVKGDTFEPYVDKNGKTVSSVRSGNVTADEMFDSLKSGNKTITWLLRLVILFVIIGGFRLMVGIVPALAKVIPFLGKGFDKILGFACTIIGIIWTFVFIGIAWIAVRPAISITLLVVIIALIIWLVIRKKKADQSETVVAPKE